MSTPVLTSEYVVARLPARTYTTLFARDGGATPNVDFRDRMIAITNSVVEVWCRGAFPNGLVADGHTPDLAIQEWAIDVLCFYAATKHPNGGDGEAYKDAYERAERAFKKLTRGQDPAPVTSGTTAEPVATAAGASQIVSPPSFWNRGSGSWSGF